MKFFTDEGVLGFEIVCCLKQRYGNDALFRRQVYFWVNEVNQDRTDLSIISSPERGPNEGVAAFIARKIDANPHRSS
jgi:hypothetical protein